MEGKFKSSFWFLAIAFSCLRRTSGLSGLGEAQSGDCGDNPVPGTLQMKFGYDIRSYTSHSMENSKKGEIFVYTCKDNASAFVQGYAKRVTLPDQFNSPFSINKKIYNKSVSFFELYEEFSNEEQTGLRTTEKSDLIGLAGKAASKAAETGGWKYAEVIAPVFEFLGALSSFLTPYKKTVSEYGKLTHNSEFRASVKSEMKVYELALKNSENLTLRADFVKDYKRLPAVFIDDPKPYEKFLETYGTHYIFKATFGGRLIYSTTHTISAHRVNERKAIEEEYEHFLEKRVNTTDEKSKLQRKIHGKTIELEVNGGDLSQAEPYGSDDIKAWEKSVYANPHPIKVSLVPIFVLIDNVTLQAQLAQAIAYSLNKHSIDRYNNDLLKIIDKDTIPAHLPYAIWNWDGSFPIEYAKHFDEVNRLITEVSVDLKSILVNCTKSFHEKINKLSIHYQNVKGKLNGFQFDKNHEFYYFLYNLFLTNFHSIVIADLWKQMNLYNDIYEAVIAIHHIASKCKFYDKDTAFKDADIKTCNNYYATRDLIKAVRYDEKVTKASTLIQLQDRFYAFKGENDKYLNGTFDCESLSDPADSGKCYIFTHCGLYKNIKGWTDKEPVDNFEDKVPVVKHLKTMLSSMKHKKEWEKHRGLFAFNRLMGNDLNCDKIWFNEC